MKKFEIIYGKNANNVCCLTFKLNDSKVSDIMPLVAKLKALKDKKGRSIFRYFGKTNEWSCIGFKTPEDLEKYCQAIFFEDREAMKTFKPKASEMKSQARALSKIKRANNKERYENKCQDKLEYFEAKYDKGLALEVSLYCENSTGLLKKNFVEITDEEFVNIAMGLDTESILRAVEVNHDEKVNNCKLLQGLWNVITGKFEETKEDKEMLSLF